MTNPGDKSGHRKYRNRITQRKSFISDNLRAPNDDQLSPANHIYRGGDRVRAAVTGSWVPPRIDHLQVYCVAKEDGVIVERGLVVALDNNEMWWCLPQLQAPDVWIVMSTPPFFIPPPSGFGSAFSSAFGAGI